jgi:hypothetical protein
MAERHVDPLFSTAYDGELDHAGRRRFDAHLDGCARCAGAWTDYRAALDALRALPAVAMPATVRLPTGPPQVEPGRAAVLGRLRDALLHPPPVWAAAGLAAAGVAAVVLAVHHPGGSTATSSPSVALTQGGGSALNSGLAPKAAPAPGFDAAGGMSQAFSAAPACAPTSVPPAGANSSAGFTHSARTSAGTGRELVLATQMDSYAAGASVPIYARLTGAPASGSADVVPCVTLLAPESSGAAGAAAPAPAAPAQGSAQQAPAAVSTVPPTPLAVATAEPGLYGASGADSSSRRDLAAGPLLNVRIPQNIPRGTVLRLVAFIPAYAAGNSTGMPLEVELLITVR